MPKGKEKETSKDLEEVLIKEGRKHEDSDEVITLKLLFEDGLLIKPTYNLPLKDTVGKFRSSQRELSS